MSKSEECISPVKDTTREFLRSFSLVECDSDADEFDELSPIPETPADEIDANALGHSLSIDSTQQFSFKSIFQPAGPYNSAKTYFWLKNVPIEVKINEHERQELKLLNPNLYKIDIKHGDHEWRIRKRYKHFRQLHDALALFRAKNKIPFPRSEQARVRQRTLKNEWSKQKSVRLPLRPEALIKEEDIPARRKLLEKYLQNLLSCKSYRQHSETLKFFEVSHLSFISRLGLKNKEGIVRKCSGGRHISIGCCGCLQKVHFAGTWNRRWLVLKDSFLAYVRPEDGLISDVMLMDLDFKVQCGMTSTGAKHGVLISNLNRNLLIQCWTSRKAKEWAECIENVAKTTALDFTKSSRFGSFAPVRDNSYARWFVDARSYFEAVADALEKAKEEIYITDWWLSPEIYMKRPIVDGDHWRLDTILERKAKQGVKVFILLYKEIEATLMIKSIYSKQILMGKHENIKVLRHPDHIPGKGILLWAHHEKLVAVDQQIAFIGGIDLCYGRWDDAEHKLIDLGSIQLNCPPSSPYPSSVSTRCEDSNITDITEVTEDLKGVDSPASRRTCVPQVNEPQAQVNEPQVSKATGVALSDIDLKAASSEDIQPGTTKKDSSSSKIPREAAGKVGKGNQHVFANVVLNSNSEELSFEKCENGGNPHMELTDKSVSNSAMPGQNADSDMTQNASGGDNPKKHLWGNKPSPLRLKIPQQDTIDESSNSSIENSSESENGGDANDPKVDTVNFFRQENVLPLENGVNGVKLRSNKDTTTNISETPHTGLEANDAHFFRREHPQSAPPNFGEIGHDEHDGFRKTKSAAGLWKKLTRMHEENNNQESQTSNTEQEDSESNLARRRWKMVFNVRKFESVVQRTQKPEKIPQDLLTGLPQDKRQSQFPGHKMHLKFRSDRKANFGDKRPVSGNLMDTFEIGVYRTHSEQDILEHGLQGSTKLWIGKDYVNFIHRDFVNLHQPLEDFIDRTKCPRMPWHDIGAVLYGKPARDVARHFIGRWNFTKLAKYKRSKFFPLLMPRTCPKVSVPQGIKDITFEVKSQVLRSASGWSAGIKKVDSSIHEAYKHCISTAKNYIYIENQFFITSVNDKKVVSNGIGEALFERILRAHRNGEVFKVYVMMPLLPAFEGEFGTATGVAIHAVTHWNYASICRGENSLIERLACEIDNPYQYIVFSGLRTWDKLNGRLVSELIYVHSKLMIVDDNTVIIGSANINDRSMLGKRDSELAVIFQDIQREHISVNGRILEPGPFGSSLRHTIFREHLGLTESDSHIDLRDVTADSFFNDVWIKQATINTDVYDKVFQCLPTDNVNNFEKLRQYTSQPNMATSNPSEATKLLLRVKGHVVLLPLQFMKDESLSPKVGTKEALLPAHLWT